MQANNGREALRCTSKKNEAIVFLTGAAQCLPAFVGLHACAESVTFLDFSCAIMLLVNNRIDKNNIEYFFMFFLLNDYSTF